MSFLSARCFVIDYKRDKYILSNFRICPPLNLTHAFSRWNEYRYVTVANKHNPNPSLALTIIIGVLILYSRSIQIYGGPGSLSHDFKIWPITFQGSGPSGPILFSCEKNLNLIKNIHLTASLRTPQNSCQFSKTGLKQPLKKRQNKDLNNKW